MDTRSPPSVFRVLLEVAVVGCFAALGSAALLWRALADLGDVGLALLVSLPAVAYACLWSVRHREALRVEGSQEPLRGLGWPNRVSLLRLLLAAPAALGVLLCPPHAGLEARTLLGGLVGVVVASDWLDGWLARRLGQATRFGVYLDPSADFYLGLVLGGCLALRGVIPLWFTGFIVWRVLALSVGGFIVLRTTGFDRSRLVASRLGRATVGGTFTCLGLGVLLWTLDAVAALEPVLIVCCALAAAGIVAALVEKTVLMRRLLREGRQTPGAPAPSPARGAPAIASRPEDSA